MNERTWRCPVQKLGEGTSKNRGHHRSSALNALLGKLSPSVDPGEWDLDISTAREVQYREGILEGRGQPIRKHFGLF